MDIWSIASGSSGNAYLARAGGATVLLECGISMSRITTFLKRQGISPYDLTGIMLTHDHSDHTRSARQISDTYGVPIFATPGTLGCAALKDAAHARPIEAEKPFKVGDLEAWVVQRHPPRVGGTSAPLDSRLRPAPSAPGHRSLLQQTR